MTAGNRNWNNISPSRTLTAGVGAGDTSFSLSGSSTDYPTAPFAARITDPVDPTVYEVILVGGKSGSTLTSITRGYNGTSAQAFVSGSFVEHTNIAEDFSDVPYPDQTNTWSAAQTFSAAATFSHASGVTTDTITERTAATGVTIDGTLIKDSGLTASGVSTFSNAAGVTTNTITERTAAAGVTADGVLLKDSIVTANSGVVFAAAALTGDGSGAVYLNGNLFLNSTASQIRSGATTLGLQTSAGVTRVGISASANVNLCAVIADPASLTGGILISNAGSAPTADPVGGGALYASGGALVWRGSAGTTTTIANA